MSAELSSNHSAKQMQIKREITAPGAAPAPTLRAAHSHYLNNRAAAVPCRPPPGLSSGTVGSPHHGVSLRAGPALSPGLFPAPLPKSLALLSAPQAAAGTVAQPTLPRERRGHTTPLPPPPPPRAAAARPSAEPAPGGRGRRPGRGRGGGDGSGPGPAAAAPAAGSPGTPPTPGAGETALAPVLSLSPFAGDMGKVQPFSPPIPSPPLRLGDLVQL